MPAVLVALGAIIFILIVIIELRFRTSDTFKKGERIPGPVTYPLIGNLLEFGLSGAEFKVLLKFIFNYGVSFRIWLGQQLVVVVSDPEDLEKILGSVNHIDKAEFYTALHPWMGTGLLTSTGEKWKSHRKMLTPTFHFKILEQFIDVFNKNGDILFDVLKRNLDGKPFDFHDYITLYTLDVICEATFGVKINAQLNSQSDYVKAVKVAADISFKRVIFPWLRSDIIFPLTFSGRDYKKALGILHGHSRKIIAERKAVFKNKKDFGIIADQNGMKQKLAFLDMLLECSNDGQYLTDNEIQEEVDTFMFEGHDTTASALGSTIGILAQKPEIQNKIVEELNRIFGDSDRPATFADLQEMKYLEQVIKEALRIFPSVPIIGRELKEEVTTKDGYVLPVGTNVAVLPIFVHRHPDHYIYAEDFNPERFNSDNYTKHHPYSYIPFSAGPRNCIGQKFALLEMKSVLSKCLRNFEFTTPRPLCYEDMIGNLVIKSKNGIIVTISERKKY